MAQSQTANDDAPTADQTALIDALNGHVTAARVNDRTGNVIARLRPDDDYHGAYLAAEEHGFEISVFDSNDYSLSLSFK